MIKKFFSISLISIAFGFLLTHQIIPHHHHGTEDIRTHTHEHGHDHNNSDHDHHLFSFLLSLLHHVDHDNSVLINQSTNSKFFQSNIGSFFLSISHILKIDDEPTLEQFAHFQFFQSEFEFLKSLNFRGPPIA